MAQANCAHGPEKEKRGPKEIGKAALFIDSSVLYPPDTNAIHVLGALLATTPQSDDFHLVASLRQRFSVAHDAVIAFVKAVRHHADSHTDPLRGAVRLAA
jgi:hypothetical protein